MGVLKRVLKKSCEGSSMKALPRIMRAGSTIQRILWVLALLVGLGAACYQLLKLIMGYLDYSTSVNIVTIQGSPPFPDVTVCHLDPHWTFRKLESELGEDIGMNHYIERVGRLQTQFNVNSTEYRRLEDLKSFPGYLQNVHRIHTEAERLKDLFIMDCYVAWKWDPYPCFGGSNTLLRNSVFLDPFFGLCVTFKIIDEQVKGLNVVLYLDDPEMATPQTYNLSDDTTTHTSMVGARVVIHPKDSFPDIWLASQHVHAGVDVGFDIEGMKRTVLDAPYGSCISASEAKQAQDDGQPGYAINRHGYECYRMCAKDHVQAQCQCLHVYYASTAQERNNYTLCGHIDERNVSATAEHINCAEGIIDSLDSGFEQKCECPIPCQQFMYEYTTKAIEWPHNTYHLSFYEQYIRPRSFADKFKVYDELLDLKAVNQTAAQQAVSKINKISRNFAQIRILNHQRTFLHYSETPLISPEALFGNVGGLLNLWVGITFITVIEILDFVHQLATTKNTGSKRTPNGTSHNPPETTEELLRPT